MDHLGHCQPADHLASAADGVVAVLVAGVWRVMGRRASWVLAAGGSGGAAAAADGPGCGPAGEGGATVGAAAAGGGSPPASYLFTSLQGPIAALAADWGVSPCIYLCMHACTMPAGADDGGVLLCFTASHASLCDSSLWRKMEPEVVCQQMWSEVWIIIISIRIQ